ncbi:ABC transporter substrate-binding protein [Denitromonas halophila]|uniref:ABC transporter substrate-binding protein n=2 Tax=Denitromonas halophila TaxID=1629404 RepID=A0A557QX36_9RHOO|nr:ABC transporter substrate-binding protein [Denitromonas halophila]TVO57478.1 ABC transporter substrate-binding protein [Denitromonas halophila]
MKMFGRNTLMTGLICLASMTAWAAPSPDALVRTVMDEVLEIVRSDEAIQSGDASRAAGLVDEKVLPHFDFRVMTSLAVGRDWRQATPAQRDRLVEAFRTLLVRTYSNALTQYRDQHIDFKPLRAKPNDTDVTVRTEVRQPGAKSIEIDYALEKQGDHWKVYDVVVAGVSLVTNYRSSFSSEIRSSGIDGLIKALEAKNAGLAGNAK